MATFPSSSKITEEEWDRNKNLIIALYLGIDHEEIECVEASEGQVKGKTLDEVARSMRGYGFDASVSQFEAKLNSWGARKNLKPEEWEQVHERLDMLPQTTKSRVLISGCVVADSKIRRARRYRKQKSRNANGVPMGGSSSSSALSHHVHIEIKEPDGRWIRLLNGNTPHTLTIPRSPRAATVGEGSTVESSLIPVVSTGLRSSARHELPPFDNNGILDGSAQEYRLEYPTTWLGSLPSRRLIKTVREYGLDCVSRTGNTVTNRAISAGMIEWNSGMPYFRGSDASLQFPNAVLAQDFGTSNKQNRVMAPADVRRSKFNQFLLSVILNGKCELEEIPTEVLDGLLGPGGAVNSLLVQCFTDAPHLFRTIAPTLLYALISQKKRDTIAKLLEKRLVHADNSVVFYQLDNGTVPLTLLETAANERDEELVELLLSCGGDPNKSYDSGVGIGALEFITQKFGIKSKSGPWPKDPPSLNVLHKLFEAGAEVSLPLVNDTLDQLDEASASLIVQHINPSQHEEYFETELWIRIVRYGEDIHVVNLFSQFVFDCVERHNGRCKPRYQQVVDFGLVMAAQIGLTKTFLAMSPHSSHTSPDLNERLLSAAIQGGQPIIINSVMLRRPDINPPPHQLYSIGRYSMEKYSMREYDSSRPSLCRYALNRFDQKPNEMYTTSPLSESIQTKNIELVDFFATAGIFNSLHMSDRFEAALSAAAEVGDINLVTCLLASCPNLDSQNMEIALCLAIKKDYEDIAHLLLEEGASAYHHYNERYSGDSQGEITLLAARKSKRSIVEKLLSIGDKTLGHRGGTDFKKMRHLTDLCLMDPDLRDNYLLSSPCRFRYEITTDLFKKELPSETHLYQVFYDHLVEDKQIRDSILDSKLATVQLLTVFLTIVISQNNLTLAEELIKRGADASNEAVLKRALRQGTIRSFQFLLLNMTHQNPVITKGLRTEVLKVAIEQGPDKYDLVRRLVESRSVDILDTGHLESHPDCGMLTPLGAAIRAAKVQSSHEFSYNVARLLLNHGCGPDDIVRFEESYPPTNHTAMLEAINVGSQELAELLIEYGANVNPELRYLVRRTPLQKAAEIGDLSMVRLLLRYGADVNARPAIAMGGTALQFAAMSGNCEIAHELLNQGALLYTTPPKIGGRWPIEGAAEHGRIEMIQFLWNAKEGTLFLGFGENGFREGNFKKAMRLARDNHHYECVELIAQLANLPVTATDVPPVVSPMYIDWPPPERTVD
ncbi:ankyrin [Xylaria cubensis]|nr:ankyrin [Xylaria cubensis]